ncbi:B-cell lymphoma 6 protein [Trema orientale]|uniref:B-cell lymphoma 6 protein n=1 Tax=Trema orientale TaxID=63057 RepID=A0A2P5FDH8_TREOI|nr:B-cell lymphoma 6 protein [Trema orientale]
MARLSSLAFVFLVLFFSLVSSSEGRKFLVTNKELFFKNEVERVLYSKASLFLSALPKGTVPSSSPSKKGHAEVDNEKLVERHLMTMDRNLQSVPSPGVGH